MKTCGSIEFAKDAISSMTLAWGEETARITIGNSDSLVGITLTKSELGRLLRMGQGVWDALDANEGFEGED